MKPTPELRFVERTIKLDPFYLQVDRKGDLAPAKQTVRILQQKWVGDYYPEWHDNYEWRDVPVVKEIEE